MKEYEYSFNVSSIKPYIDYCIKNKYIKTSETKENRIVYESIYNNNLIARITNVLSNNNEIIVDAKNITSNKNVLKISKESLPLKIKEEDISSIKSLLEVSGFQEKANNIRTRYVYELNNVKFEIDEYEKPKMSVVAIEGKKEEVDKIYNELLDRVKEEVK